MIVIDANVFNKELMDRLLRLSDKAETINPENINVLPFNPFGAVDSESAVGPASSFEYPDYDDNCIVNSIRMGKIKSMIRHLKVNKQKYLLVEQIKIDSTVINDSFAYDYVDASGNGIYQAGNTLTISIPVPNGFDGRKCFPFYGMNSVWGLSPLNSYARTFNAWLNGQDEGSVGAQVFQNKNTIKFEFKLVVDDGTVQNPDIYIRLFYWENVL